MMTVTSSEQARALQDVAFLGSFLEPASPSGVARELGMAANLAHHHAKRLAALGLLNEVKRESGKVYYQLAAKVFRHDRSLLPTGEDDEYTSVLLSALKERFLEAYQRAGRTATHQDKDWQYYSFVKEWSPPKPDTSERSHTPPAFPAHFETRTLTLSAERYRQLLREIRDLIASAESDTGTTSRSCTLSFAAFEGVLLPDARCNHTVASFLPPGEPQPER